MANLEHPRAGERANLASFAALRWWTGSERHELVVHELQADADSLVRPARHPETGEWHVGLEWDEPRDVREIVVRYADPTPIPPDVKVQYWRQNWPTPAPERLPGARRGWIGRDDPWHGQWTTVRCARINEGNACTWIFDPIDLAELKGPNAATQLEEAEHYLASFRRTLKIRLVSSGSEQPLIEDIRAYSASRWQEAQVDVRFGPGIDAPSDWSGHAEVINGYLLDASPLDFEAGDEIRGDSSWQCHAGARSKGVRLRILYAANDPTSGDHTLVTVRCQAHSFTFLVADLDRGPIYIRDYDVYITWTESAVPFLDYQAQWAAASRSLYDRVPDEPEHSLARAMAEIPPLDVTKQAPFGRYLPLGVEAGRQQFAVRYNGELFADKRVLKLAGRDAARLLWPGHQIRFRFGSGDPPDFRERPGATSQSLLDGWLPVVVSRWQDRQVEYKQTAFVTLLDGPMTGPDARRGDESLVALLRFEMRNATPGRQQALLWLAITPQEQIDIREDMGSGRALVVASGRIVPGEPVARQWKVSSYEGIYLRCAVDVGGRGHLAAVPYAGEQGLSLAVPTTALYRVDLAGGEAHTIDLFVPFATLTQPDEWAGLGRMDLEAKLSDVVAYWQRTIGSGGQMEVPDIILADLHKAVRTHVAISVDKDPVSGLLVVPAATWSYGACGNEACWQITMLDQAGHHDRARSYLETFLRTQGAIKPDGKFTSAEGALQAADLDAGAVLPNWFAYNLDHGVIMECLANHYQLTGDRAWLERVAPQLVAACDLVIRERKSTRTHGRDGGPVPEWGLLPAGHLEDNREWRHWFAVNAHAYNGQRSIAQALAEIDHPEAPRLALEAAEYREDIRRAALRAMVEAPVVRLLDGTYVPHIPTRTGIRGREWGWFREAAYGALHLMEGNVFDPEEPEMTWLLQDLEDNLFVSREWGRPVDLERYWFSHGGATIQPNLTDLGIDYLRRGQIQHALRALFNNLGSSLYPDVRTFTEHPVVELGHGVGPFYKSSDESKALVWLRAFLIWEQGQELHLAPGAPRAWFAPGQSWGVSNMATIFGPLTYRVRAEDTMVVIQVELSDRRPPHVLVLHIRHPALTSMQSVTVNGKLHADLDPTGETVRIANPSGTLQIQVRY